MEHKEMFKELPGDRTDLGVPSGFIMIWGQVTNKKRELPAAEDMDSFSLRWINIWIVCPRCNWSGLKTYHLLSQGPGTQARWRPRGLEKRQLSAHQRTLGGLSAELGVWTSRASGRKCSSPPVKGHRGFPPPSQRPWGTTPGTAAQQPVESQRSLLGAGH